MEKVSSKTIQANVESIEGYEMRMLPIMLVLAVFSINSISGCDSRRDKEKKSAKEHMKKLGGDFDKDFEAWKKAQKKPTKPMWNQ